MVNLGLGTESYYLSFWPYLAVFINAAKLFKNRNRFIYKEKNVSFIQFICSKFIADYP